jgi:hypothetical protein
VPQGELSAPRPRPVERCELPHLHGLDFVLHGALGGGVNASLNLDSHGKSWSYLVLGLEVEIDDVAQAPARAIAPVPSLTPPALRRECER